MNTSDLRRYAIHNTFSRPTTLKRALQRLVFVQADPIRSPARAQDLILRHRVSDYRAGDLEEKYPNLDIEEDIVYAYGFVSRPLYELLHPRPLKKRSPIEDAALEIIRVNGLTHPRALAKELATKSVKNYWGGSSNETTRALESLHRHGLLRVAKREKGIRLYEPARETSETLPPAERYLRIVEAAIKIFAPAPEKNIHSTLAPVRRILFGKKRMPTNVEPLIKDGTIRRETVDGVAYLWPAGKFPKKEVPQDVRILAPFDPLVWDRQRFEHFWGWKYRFEAYTPANKRIRGYYAMPLLWREEIIGWANINTTDGKLETKIGYADKRPEEKDFTDALESELDHMRRFLGCA